MPIYEYTCTTCDTHFEESRSIKLGPRKVCDCGGSLEQVYHPPALITWGTDDPKTVGTLAYANAKKNGKYWLEDKKIYDSNRKMLANEARRERISEKLPRGASLIDNKSRETPFWRKGTAPDEIDTSLNKLSPDGIKKYIETGKK